MGLFDGLGEAEIFERGTFVEAGFSGVVEVKRVLAKETRAAGLAFIVEMEVVETNMEETHPEGQRVTWFQKMTDQSVAFPAIKAWAAACAGYLPSDKEAIQEKVAPYVEEEIENAIENPDENNFVGIKLRLQTTGTKTKKDLDFTRYDFFPYGGGDDDDDE